MNFKKVLGILVFSVQFMAASVFSETLEEYAEACKQELEIDFIPGYSCLDGIELTAQESADLLIPPRGVVRFGRVATSNPKVDAVFLCRNINGSTVALDGYILQNRENGKSCFFDKKSNSSIVAPPIDFSTQASADLANQNWRSPSQLSQGGPCLNCHNNDPYIISGSLSRAAKELGLLGTDRPLSENYSIVESDVFGSPIYDGNNKILSNVSFGADNCAAACHTVSGSFTSMSDMPALPGSHFVSWPTERLMHMESGHCIHPLYGTAHEGTKAVTWSGCDDQSRLKFEFTNSGKIQEKASNKCLDVDSVSAGQNVVYRSDCSSAQAFSVTTIGQIKAANSNLCLEPANDNRVNDTEIVLKTCSTSLNQKFTSIAVSERKIVQSTSDMCWRTEDGSSYPAANKRNVVLSNNCSDESSSFALLDNGLIKHIPSGYCVHPEGGTAEQLDNFLLYPSCDYEYRLSFEITKYGSVKHKQSGMCAHPYLGSANPAEGTEVIFHAGCNTGSDPRLKFIFEH